MSEKKELETRGERDIEQTRSGPVFVPAVDIFETQDKISVLADMPGVNSDHLTIDLRENVLTLNGVVHAPESDKEASVLTEFESAGTYYRRFTLHETIDQSKIEASLKNGVLHLQLPKVEAAKPRKIAVKTS